LLFSRNASAVDRTWLNPSGGTFQAPGNWSGSAVPGPADAAIFSMFAPPYTVSFTGSHSSDDLQIDTGNVTFDYHDQMRADRLLELSKLWDDDIVP
jgi:hypothetical protein